MVKLSLCNHSFTIYSNHSTLLKLYAPYTTLHTLHYTQVPLQANGFDCGLFVTKFASEVLTTQPSSTTSDISTKFVKVLRSDAFSQTDVDLEREKMLKMLSA